MISDKPLGRPGPIDIEKEFCALVRANGGVVIRDTMPDTADMPLNADFYFPTENVVVELKSLEKDKFAGGDGLMDLLRTLRHSGQMNGSEIIQWNFGQRQLPASAAKALFSSFRRTIETQARKAQRQIKKTISLHGNENTKGLVIFANDNSHLLTPLQMVSLIANVFGNRFNARPMDAFVYTNVNVPSLRFDGDLDWHFWMPSYRDETDEHLGAFINKLGAKWLEHFNSLSDGPFVPRQEFSEIGELAQEFPKLHNVRLRR